jgi:hypothetical protein
MGFILTHPHSHQVANAGRLHLPHPELLVIAARPDEHLIPPHKRGRQLLVGASGPLQGCTHGGVISCILPTVHTVQHVSVDSERIKLSATMLPAQLTPRPFSILFCSAMSMPRCLCAFRSHGISKPQQTLAKLRNTGCKCGELHGECSVHHAVLQSRLSLEHVIDVVLNRH